MIDFSKLTDDDIVKRMRVLSDQYDDLKPKLCEILTQYEDIQLEYNALLGEIERRVAIKEIK